MEYFLRQIETGKPDPLIIKLNSDDVVVGKDIYPVLAKYPHVLPQHAQFVRQFGKWYVKSMQSSEKIHVNGSPLVTHRLKEIQIGDHIKFGSAKNEKCFVCCLGAKASRKLPTIELIDLSDESSTEDSSTSDIRSADNDRIIKNESSDNSIHFMGHDQVKAKDSIIGENFSENIRPPAVKSEHANDCQPFQTNKPMDWNTATVENEFENIRLPTVKSVQMKDSLLSVNRDSKDKTLQTSERELDYSCPPTVRNDYLDDLPLVTESEPKDRTLPVVEREVDYSCPPTVRNDYLDNLPPLIKSEPQDTSLPATENELDYSCPPTVRNDFVPFIKDEPVDSSLPVINNDSLNNRHLIMENEPVNFRSSVIKSEPMDTNSLFIKSEPMDTTNPLRECYPANTVPFLSNELLSNSLPTVKREPVEDIIENTFLYNYVPSTSQSNAVSLNEIVSYSAKEPKITSEQFRPTSLSSSSINNRDFFEKPSSSKTDSE